MLDTHKCYYIYTPSYINGKFLIHQHRIEDYMHKQTKNSLMFSSFKYIEGKQNHYMYKYTPKLHFVLSKHHNYVCDVFNRNYGILWEQH